MGDNKTIDEQLREKAVQIVKRKIGLKFHWASFLFVNILLFIINTLTGYRTPWHYWVLVPWSVGILIHSFELVLYKSNKTIAQKQLLYHFVISILVSGLLIFINLFTNRGQISWVFWPLGGIWAAVIIHFIIKMMFAPKSQEDHNKSYIDRQIEREMKKLGHLPKETNLNSEHSNENMTQNVGKKTFNLYNDNPQAAEPNNSSSEDIKSSIEIKFCPKCGNQLKDKNTFCSYCGSKIYEE